VAEVRVEFNEAGLAELAHGPEVTAAVLAVAETGKAYAESIAPRRSGHYAASFEVSVETVTVAGRERVAAQLTNTAGYAAAVEYGPGGRKDAPAASARRVLGRTLDHLQHPEP
jgi:hypothetical protein